MSELELFARELQREADDQYEYAQNLVRANGGDDTEMSERLDGMASVLSSVAQAAFRAVEQGRSDSGSPASTGRVAAAARRPARNAASGGSIPPRSK